MPGLFDQPRQTTTGSLTVGLASPVLARLDAKPTVLAPTRTGKALEPGDDIGRQTGLDWIEPEPHGRGDLVDVLTPRAGGGAELLLDRRFPLRPETAFGHPLIDADYEPARNTYASTPARWHGTGGKPRAMFPSDELHFVLHLLLAYLLALPIALNRERQARSAGLRTFPLVATAACAYLLLGLDFFTEQEAQARVLYGLMTGIGFIGGGAILKQNGRTRGTATATSLWMTGAVGAAVAFQYYTIAVVAAFLDLVTLSVGKALKGRIARFPREGMR